MPTVAQPGVDLTEDLLALIGSEDSLSRHASPHTTRTSSRDSDHTSSPRRGSSTPDLSPSHPAHARARASDNVDPYFSTCKQCRELLPTSWFASFVHAGKALPKAKKCFICRGRHHSPGITNVLLAQKFLRKYLRTNVDTQLGHNYILLDDGQEIVCEFTQDDLHRVQDGLVAMLTAKLKRADKSMDAEDIQRRLEDCIAESADEADDSSHGRMFKTVNRDSSPVLNNNDESGGSRPQKRKRLDDVDALPFAHTGKTQGAHPVKHMRMRKGVSFEKGVLFRETVTKFDGLRHTLRTSTQSSSGSAISEKLADFSEVIAVLADAVQNLLAVFEGYKSTEEEDDREAQENDKDSLAADLSSIIRTLHNVREEGTVRAMDEMLGVQEWADYAQNMSRLLVQSKVLLVARRDCK